MSGFRVGLMLLVGLGFVSCALDSNSSSSVSTNSFSNSSGNLNSSSSSTPKSYRCIIDRIYVSSLNTKGWDPLDGYGDPYFKLQFNGSNLYTTEYKLDPSPSVFPVTFYVNKEILNYKDGTFGVQLWDKDGSVDDQMLTWDGMVLSPLQSSISISYPSYNLSAKIYLNWVAN